MAADEATHPGYEGSHPRHGTKRPSAVYPAAPVPMARIALITDRLGGRAGGGGAARQMLELGRGLRDLGHDVTVACLEYEAESAFAQSMEGLDVRAVHREIGASPVGRFELLRRMRRGMAEVAALLPTDVDVVNAHEWPALHAARVASRRLGVPAVWTRNDGTSLPARSSCFAASVRS